ncbi:hypothetical protein Taro_049420 [Colocasia esculenta]|uniref:CCHC-type domain-containing protein n=1 Tax=Colocasia esculenta TaxID=4460 RepID=A0A843XAQ4_COLES|nr:hypothetical protein [Colocasia esculenta]
MTVLKYEARFSEHSKYAPHIVTDERRKTKKFVMGLKPSLRTRLMAFDHRTLDEALSAACRKEGEMEQYLQEKKASQKRPAATFQQQDKKKAVYPTQQRPVAVGSTQVPSVRSPGVKKECPHCGRTHGGSECWMITGNCLKCGSSNHKIKDCPSLQQGVQHGAPALAAVAAASESRSTRVADSRNQTTQVDALSGQVDTRACSQNISFQNWRQQVDATPEQAPNWPSIMSRHQRTLQASSKVPFGGEKSSSPSSALLVLLKTNSHQFDYENWSLIPEEAIEVPQGSRSSRSIYWRRLQGRSPASIVQSIGWDFKDSSLFPI